MSKKGDSKIKDCFISRWGDDGVIVEADLSQIEVVVQAFLSQDEQMIKDVVNGIDFHCKRLAFTLKQDYQEVWDKCHVEEDPAYKKMRTNIKVFSFQNQYGAGPTKIAETINLPVSEVKEFFITEERMYPSISRMQEGWADEVESNKVISTLRTFKGNPAKTSFYRAVTGKQYGFVEEDVPKNMQMFSAYKEDAKLDDNLTYKQFMHYGKPKLTSFKPTKIKNLQVQGLAGEILYLILGELNRRLLNSEELIKKCLLINTVHDSIVLDVHKSKLSKVKTLLLEVMESAPTLFERTFGIKFNLPVKGEVEAGINWGSKRLI